MVRQCIAERAASRADAWGREELVSSTSLAIKTGKRSGAGSGVRWQSVSAEPHSLRG